MVVLVVVVGFVVSRRMSVARFSLLPSVHVRREAFPLVLAELQVGAPASVSSVAAVGRLWASNLAALMPLCGAVPAFRQHWLAQETGFRLGSTGFTAGFLSSLSLIVVLLRTSGF